MSDKSQQKGSWTLMEKKIFDGLMPLLGKEYSQYIKHLPNKSYNQIKGRYHNLEKKQLQQLIDDSPEKKEPRKKSINKHQAEKQDEQSGDVKFTLTNDELGKLVQLITKRIEQ